MNQTPLYSSPQNTLRIAMSRNLLVMFIVVSASVICLQLTAAHEGHKPLPTRGMEVDAETGRMLLTKMAREILDVQTAEVGPQQLSQSVLAYGTDTFVRFCTG